MFHYFIIFGNILCIVCNAQILSVHLIHLSKLMQDGPHPFGGIGHFHYPRKFLSLYSCLFLFFCPDLTSLLMSFTMDEFSLFSGEFSGKLYVNSRRYGVGFFCKASLACVCFWYSSCCCPSVVLFLSPNSCMNTPWLAVQSPVHGGRGAFWFRAVKNKASVNIFV